MDIADDLPEPFLRVEDAYHRQMADAAPNATRAQLGIAAERVGGALAVRAPGAPHFLLNRVIASGPLGDDEASFERAAGCALDHQLRHGVLRLLLTVTRRAPERWLTARALTPFRRWVVLARDAAPPPRVVNSALTIVRAGPDRAHEAAALAVATHHVDEATIPWLAALVGRPSFHVYVALDGADVVGVGTLFVSSEVGYLTMGATRVDARRRGAQSALLARRIQVARDLGCRVLYSETGEAVAGDPQTSYRNMQRQGFAPVALRYNYLLAAPPVGALARTA